MSRMDKMAICRLFPTSRASSGSHPPSLTRTKIETTTTKTRIDEPANNPVFEEEQSANNICACRCPSVLKKIFNN